MSIPAGVLRTLLAGLLLSGCGKSGDSAEKSPAPVSSAAPTTLPALPAPPAPSPVLLSISANQSIETTVSAGWPVVIDAKLMLKPRAGASLTLSNASGPWSDALSIECSGPGGALRSPPFKPAYASEKGIELTAARSGLMVWVLDSVEPSTLPEGSYRIRVVVDEKKLGGSLPGGVASNTVSLVVAPAPANPSRGAAQRKCLARMSASAWANDPAKALATAGAYLAEHPKDVAVLLQQGNLQRSQGMKAEALSSYEAALKVAEEHREPMGENFGILELIADLRNELKPK
ncbi:MAG TPA: hypothetical protein VE981_19905 [Planctomycetota bacterium]|nr:hypothetical protein [Planctomycetota bacterium]